eukprot:8472481-Alexandrium_andersonii.AAC.1
MHFAPASLFVHVLRVYVHSPAICVLGLRPPSSSCPSSSACWSLGATTARSLQCAASCVAGDALSQLLDVDIIF